MNEIRYAFAQLVRRLRNIFRRRSFERDLDEEMQFHRAMAAEHGFSPAAFGSETRYKEEVRDARGMTFIDDIARDVRLAVRRLLRAPSYSVGIAGTLAIALAATAGIGTLVYGVMLKPLPYPDADRLVRIGILTPGMNISTDEQSAGTLAFLRERARSFSELAAYSENQGIAITDADAPERVVGAIVTPNALTLAGATPAAGRLLVDSDANEDPMPVLISHALWQRRFGGDPRVTERTIELNRRPRRILGVLPKEFDLPSRDAAVFYPDLADASPGGDHLGDRNLTVIARLAPGVSAEQAQREVNALLPQLPERYPRITRDAIDRAGLYARVQTFHDALIAPIRTALTLIALMIAALLCIAGANAATLSLVRADRMRDQAAVARALGAGTVALIRPFVIEGLVLGIVAAVAALPVVAFATATKFGLTAAQIPRLDGVTMSGMTVAATLLVGAVVGASLGLLSAFRASSGATAALLRTAARATGGKGWRRTQQGLVAAQVACAFALLVAASMLTQSLVRLNRIDIGFEPSDRAKFSLVLPFSAYPSYQSAAAFDLAVIDALRNTPGIHAAGAAMQFPATTHLLYVHPRVEARASGGGTRSANVTVNIASAGFFGAMDIPIRAGRTFTAGDLNAPSPAVVLSESLARDLFGDEDPIGREVRYPSPRYPPYTVVGVSGDVYAERIADGVLRVLYFPLLGDVAANSADTVRLPFVPAGMHFVVRSNQPLSKLAPVFRSAVAGIDPRVPVWEIRSLDDLASDVTAQHRLTAILFGIGALATLLLGAAGLYSVIAYAAQGRAREFAVRLALGATTNDVMRLVFREGGFVTLTGALLGGVASIAIARALGGILYEVSVANPAHYGIVATAVLACCAAAIYVPAKRASREDPVSVLREGAS
jgi:predicted permease